MNTKSEFDSDHFPTILSAGPENITFTYAGVTDTVSRKKLMAASRASLDEDIAILRIIIRSLLRNDPANFPLLLRAIDILASLVSLRRDIVHPP